jgi:hypothetical protein
MKMSTRFSCEVSTKRGTLHFKSWVPEREERDGAYFPSGVLTSVPDGGVNSKVDSGMGARD